MNKPFYGFFVSLFNVLLVWIVFANFLGWSGGAVNVTGYQGINWDNSYIGFESLTMMIEDLNSSTWYGQSINVSSFLRDLENLGNAITLGIPKFLAALNNFHVTDILNLIFTIAFAPSLILGYTLLCILHIVIYIILIVYHFIKLCGGAYNIPFDDTSDIWSQWSYLSSEWDWSNIPSSVLVPRAL